MHGNTQKFAEGGERNCHPGRGKQAGRGETGLTLAGSAGVCDFMRMSEGELSVLFSRIKVSEVWGVGQKIYARLQAMGVSTVADLRNADPETVRTKLSVVLERTVRELRGLSCLDLEEVVPDKQQIMCSRSFGERIYERSELGEAVASYVSRAAEKRVACSALVRVVAIRGRNSLGGI